MPVLSMRQFAAAEIVSVFMVGILFVDAASQRWDEGFSIDPVFSIISPGTIADHLIEMIQDSMPVIEIPRIHHVGKAVRRVRGMQHREYHQRWQRLRRFFVQYDRYLCRLIICKHEEPHGVSSLNAQ